MDGAAISKESFTQYIVKFYERLEINNSLMLLTQYVSCILVKDFVVKRIFMLLTQY